MSRRPDNTEIDATTQAMRCRVCGDEIPIPYGIIPWVAGVMKLFADAHREPDHTQGRTRFSTPVRKDAAQ